MAGGWHTGQTFGPKYSAEAARIWRLDHPSPAGPKHLGGSHRQL